MSIVVKVGVLMGSRGYRGVVHGCIGGRTIWTDTLSRVHRDIMAAYTDARIAAERMRV